MIIPAILEQTFQKTTQEIEIFQNECKVLHIDIGDGEFISHKSHFKIEDLQNLNEFTFQIHLMTMNPKMWIDKKIKNVDTVIFQIESAQDYLQTAKFFKELGYKVGLSINTATAYPKIFENIDFVQFMTVEPGKQGQELLSSTFEKIQKFVHDFSYIKTQADGGINVNNIQLLQENKIQNFVVGSAIVKSKNPIAELKKLNALID